MFPIDSSRAVVGGQASAVFRQLDLFNDMLALENLLSNDQQNVQLKQNYATARRHYLYTKDYAIKTGPLQLGLTDEELAAAERLAAGDTGPVTVELDTALADQLKAELEAQRLEEKRLKDLAIAEAQAALEAKQAEAQRLADEEAAAAAKAAEAAEAKRKADALAQALADYEASQAAADDSSTTTPTRRRLQANPDVPTSDVPYECDPALNFDDVEVDVMQNANFSAENMAFIKCYKTYNDAIDTFAKEQLAAAEALKKAKEAEVAAAEDSVTEAYVAPVKIEGQLTPEEKIAEAKTELSKITSAIRKEQDDSAKQLLVTEQIQIASKLKFLEDALKEIKQAEAEADPAAAERQREAEARAKRLEEKRNALTPDVITNLQTELNAAIAGGEEAVQALMNKYAALKTAAQD